jgi:hypothetical protein
MAKYQDYEGLSDYLKAQDRTLVPMTFDEVATVVGRSLPRSAKYPAWWSNNPSNNAMTKVWLDAGFKTEHVDVEGRKLVFRRRKQRPLQLSEPSEPGVAPSSSAKVEPAGTSIHERLQYIRSIGPQKGPVSPGMADVARSYSAEQKCHPAFGSMKGLIQIVAGTDLTKPAADPKSWKRRG